MTASRSRAVTGSALPSSVFDYPLPEGRIAQRPIEPRDGSRLLHLAPGGEPTDHEFRDLPALLRDGDLLVANDTRVRAARLLGTRPGGGAAELLVLERLHGDRYACLARPSRKLTEGTTVGFGDSGLTAVVGGRALGHPGAREVAFASPDGDADSAIERAGRSPLPPYIQRHPGDPGRYQTVYAEGPPLSAAAPTAGLHFTPAVLERLRNRGVDWTTVQLDVGLGTFAPIRACAVEDHHMHEERCAVADGAAEAVRTARARGGRVIAVGTTVVRTLESHANQDGTVSAGEGRTRLYLRPGSTFRVVDGLLTNFHQPRSSLLVMLAAFVGVDLWRAAYDHALDHDYRFLSFGDCMLCWRGG